MKQQRNPRSNLSDKWIISLQWPIREELDKAPFVGGHNTRKKNTSEKCHCNWQWTDASRFFIFLEGLRVYHQSIYVSDQSVQRIHFQMESNKAQTKFPYTKYTSINKSQGLLTNHLSIRLPVLQSFIRDLIPKT